MANINNKMMINKVIKRNGKIWKKWLDTHYWDIHNAILLKTNKKETMVRKKMIYKIIKYGIILIVWIVVLKLAFHDFKPEYLISWNAFSNWWIDTYAGLFKMILSIILGITLIWGIGWLLWKWLRAFFIFIFRHNPES